MTQEMSYIISLMILNRRKIASTMIQQLKICYKTSNSYQETVSIIFSSDNISQRIQQFSRIGEDISQKQQILLDLPIESKTPSFLKFETGKNLGAYIKQQNITVSVRIIHALCHIEQNAFMSYADTYFNLSSQIVDSIERELFRKEMKRIALEEGSHFELLEARLQKLGYKYGDIPVIGQLSSAIKETNTDLLMRIATISLIHQGKGTKAVKKLIRQLENAGDTESVELMNLIQKQEKGHYSSGLKWFQKVFRQQGFSLQEAVKIVNQKSSVAKLDFAQTNQAIHQHCI